MGRDTSDTKIRGARTGLAMLVTTFPALDVMSLLISGQ
jgi:hypothetical protein